MREQFVIATTDWMDRLKKDQVFMVKKTFFWNGEHWHTLRGTDGKLVNLPAIFFDEL